MTDFIAFTTVYHYDKLSSNPKKLDWFFCLVDTVLLTVITFYLAEFKQFFTAENLVALTGSRYMCIFIFVIMFLWIGSLLWKASYVFWKHPRIFLLYIAGSMCFDSKVFLYTRIQ